MLPTFMWIVLGALIGILFRFFVPYLRKIKEGEITWSDIDKTYVVEAVLTFFTAYLTVFAALSGGILPDVSWALFFAAFIAGIGEMEIFNEIIKFIGTVK